MEEGGRIVVGVDGSPSSRRVLHWAARQAKLTGASLEVVTCWEYPVTYSWSPPYRPIGVDLAHKAHRKLERTVAEALGGDPGVNIELIVVGGHAAPVLLDAAKGASLLVIGSRGHGAFTGMLLGSVSDHCVRHGPCPVTVVRGAGDQDSSHSG
jgi:nucleotide-binding universal stress UspA family protein